MEKVVIELKNVILFYLRGDFTKKRPISVEPRYLETSSLEFTGYSN